MALEAVAEGRGEAQTRRRTPSGRMLRILVPRRQLLDNVPQVQEAVGLLDMTIFRPYGLKLRPHQMGCEPGGGFLKKFAGHMFRCPMWPASGRFPMN